MKNRPEIFFLYSIIGTGFQTCGPPTHIFGEWIRPNRRVLWSSLEWLALQELLRKCREGFKNYWSQPVRKSNEDNWYRRVCGEVFQVTWRCPNPKMPQMTIEAGKQWCWYLGLCKGKGRNFSLKKPQCKWTEEDSYEQVTLLWVQAIRESIARSAWHTWFVWYWWSWQKENVKIPDASTLPSRKQAFVSLLVLP